jgi:hypothetical protein
MLVPYAALFAAACCVSLLAGGVKMRLFIGKWRSRNSSGGRGQKRLSVGGVQISPHMTGHFAVGELKDRFDVHRLERYKYGCYLLVAVFEDLPMGRALPDGTTCLTSPRVSSVSLRY